jgi:hypothetical protein
MIMPDIFSWGFEPEDLHGWPREINEAIKPTEGREASNDQLHVVHVRAWQTFTTWVEREGGQPKAVLYLPLDEQAPQEAWVYVDLVLSAEQPDVKARLEELVRRPDIIEAGGWAMEVPTSILTKLRRRDSNLKASLQGVLPPEAISRLGDPLYLQSFEFALRDRMLLIRETAGLDEQEAVDYVRGRLRRLYEEGVAEFVRSTSSGQEVFDEVIADMGMAVLAVSLQPREQGRDQPPPGEVGPREALLLAALWALRRRRHSSYADVRGEEATDPATAAHSFIAEGEVLLEHSGFSCKIAVRAEGLRVREVRDAQGRSRRTFWVTLAHGHRTRFHVLSVAEEVLLHSSLIEERLSKGPQQVQIGVASDRWYIGV